MNVEKPSASEQDNKEKAIEESFKLEPVRQLTEDFILSAIAQYQQGRELLASNSFLSGTTSPEHYAYVKGQIIGQTNVLRTFLDNLGQTKLVDDIEERIADSIRQDIDKKK